MHERLIIIGVNGHGKVIADIALAMGKYQKIEFLCNFENKKECMGYPIVGKTGTMCDFIQDSDFIVAIGDAGKRKEIMEVLIAAGASLATLIHPSAVIGSKVTIGEGTVVMPGAVINVESVIGKGCIINTASSVDHNCVLGDYVHVAVGAHLCGMVTIHDMTWIGAGATIINGVHLCADCMIGAGAVVTKNIKEKGTYVGVPARRTI